jgi:Polyketide cyclase / dehydrase and lipid transport
MVRIDGEIVIGRPVDEVFDFVADERNEPSYNHQMTAVELVTEEPIGPGSRFQAELRMGGRPIDLTVEFTRFERPRVLGSISYARPRGRGGRSMRTEGALTFSPFRPGRACVGRGRSKHLGR